jgi:hypothetical protein
MSGLPWKEPFWGGCDKHRPITNGTPWTIVRDGTNEGKKIAKYHEEMTFDDIEELEMSFTDPNDFIYERKGVRYYYARSYQDGIVGASYGQDTAYIVIQRQQSGFVHGYPETRARLISKMREHNRDLLERFLKRYPK